jgi:hypothetical protein
MKVYTFPLTDPQAFKRVAAKLFAAILIVGLPWAILFLTGVIQFWSGWGLLYLLSGIGLPFWWYSRKRRTAFMTASAVITDEGLSVTIKAETTRIRFDEMRSFYTTRIQMRKPGLASVKIRKKGGQKYNFYASEDICDIEALDKFRLDFDQTARNAGVESKFWD